MTLVYVLGGIVSSFAVLGAIHRCVVKPLVRLFRKAEAIADTWHGEPARDGLPARPGIVARLTSIESAIKVNGTGLPLGDAVARVIRDTADLKRGQDAARTAAEGAQSLVAQVKEEHEVALIAAQDERAAIAARLTPLEEWVAAGQLREETYRDSLREIHGIDVPPAGTGDTAA